MNARGWIVLCAVPLLAACPEYGRTAVENTAPVVDAFEARTVDAGETVTLSATGTDADGDALSWSWRQTAGVGVVLSSNTEREVTFVAPMASTVLVFEVRAHDGFDPSEPAIVHVAVRYNRPPVADAGGLWTTPNGMPLRLRGDAQDPDGDPIVAWQWTMVGGPPGADLDAVLEDAETRLPTFRPSVKGEYRVELQASDGEAFGDPDEAVLIAENRPPVAVGIATVSPADPRVFDLDGTGSWDPDDDDIAAWRWEIVSVPAAGHATFLGSEDDPLTTVEVTGSGSFEIALTVTDADGLQSAPARVFVYANQPPILVLAREVVVAPSGEAFDLDASATVDPDGDDFFVTWTRVAGNAAFPAQQVGVRPTIVAPSYKALFDAGEPTWALYEVVASDGQASSEPQTVTVYAGPSLDEYVVVSSRPEADDSGDCGALVTPCATLGRALEIVTGGGAYGDGRAVLMTTGNFDEVHEGGLTLPSDVDVFGGRDAITFVAAGVRTNLRMHDPATTCFQGQAVGLRLTAGSLVRLEGLEIEVLERGCDNPRVVICSGCDAELHDVRILASGGTTTRGLFVANGGEVLLTGSEVRSAGAGYMGQAIFVNSGDVTVRDSDLIATGSVSWTLTGIEHQGGGSVVLDRVYVTTQGSSGSDGTGATIRVQDSLTMRNTVVRQQVLANRPAVRGGQSTTILNSTLVTSSRSISGSYVVISPGVVRVANTLLDGAAGGLALTTPDGRGSRLYHNAIATSGGPALRCRDPEGDPLEAEDPDDLEVCNDTGDPWIGNVAGPCALIDEAGGDLRLNALTANPCIDGGTANSPAGVAPDVDKDQNPRPAGAAHDIGAYEAP
jgi:hypothetical protein